MATTTLTTASSSPWSTPQGATNLVIECWGAGGGGGGNAQSTDGAGGGGGGAYSKKTIASPTGDYAFVVGVKGNGGIAAGGEGTPGNDTWFISNNSAGCVAKGGSGGKPTANDTHGAGGSGGLASAGYGDAKHDGGWGEDGRESSAGQGGYGGSSAGTAADGIDDGSSSSWSTTTFPTGSSPTGAGYGGNGGGVGSAGAAPASGNGGGGGGAGEGTQAGGDGADGKIVLTWDESANIDVTANSVSKTLAKFSALVGLGIVIAAQCSSKSLTTYAATVGISTNVSASSASLTVTPNTTRSALANSVKIRWRKNGGAWTDLSDSGEVTWSAATDLVNGADVSSGEAGCTPGSGTSWVDGVEREGANAVPTYLESGEYTEHQWAIDLSGATDGAKYEFELYDSTTDTSIGTCAADITLAAAGINATCVPLTLTSYAPNINAALNVQAASAALTLTSYPPSINAKISIQAASASLSLTTYGAVIKADTNIAAGTKALTITTYPALGENVPASISGQSAAVAVNAPDVSVESAIAGVSVPVAPGTPDISYEIVFELTGVEAGAFVNDPNVSIESNIVGVSVPVDNGAFTVSVETNLAGLSVAANSGEVSALTAGSMATPLTGIAVPVSTGALTISVATQLSGIAAATNNGTLSVDVGAALTGVSVPTATGSFTVSVQKNIVGIGVPTAVGTITALSADMIFPLVGVSVPVSVGTLTQTFDVSCELSGVSASVAVGSLSANPGLPSTVDLTGLSVPVSVNPAGAPNLFLSAQLLETGTAIGTLTLPNRGANLDGLSVAATLGNIQAIGVSTPSTVTLTGLSVPVAVDTNVSISWYRNINGLGVPTAIGTPTVNAGSGSGVYVPLTGISVPAAINNAGFFWDVKQRQTGKAVGVAKGSLSISGGLPSRSVTLTGISVPEQFTNPSVKADRVISITGRAAGVRVGSLYPFSGTDSDAVVQGESADVAVGSLSAIADTFVSITGESVDTDIGSLGVNSFEFLLTGISVPTDLNDPSVEYEAVELLNGTYCGVRAGSPYVTQDVVHLTGVSAGTARGTVSVSGLSSKQGKTIHHIKRHRQ